MKMSEFRKWLASNGASFKEGSRHTKVYLHGRQTTLPRHASEIHEGLRQAILKQLGLK
jgi:mRNA interferase HicA